MMGYISISGCWYTYPSEKYEFVNGKDDIPYMKWKIKNVPDHQPVILWFCLKIGYPQFQWIINGFYVLFS
jgi:hypothetical protein